MASLSPGRVFDKLFRCYGPQHWWPGDTPFEVIIGAVLTQNTAWLNVERAILNLKQANAMSATAILQTPHHVLAQWLRPAGYFNIKATRLKHVCDWYSLHGEYAALQHWSTTQLRESLLAVHGIGPETADDILLYVFNRPVFVIDAYTRRLFMRLNMIKGDEPYERLRALLESRLQRRANTVVVYNEFHALIVRHAKECCRTKPVCYQCVLQSQCPSKVTTNH